LLLNFFIYYSIVTLSPTDTPLILATTDISDVRPDTISIELPRTSPVSTATSATVSFSTIYTKAPLLVTFTDLRGSTIGPDELSFVTADAIEAVRY